MGHGLILIMVRESREIHLWDWVETVSLWGWTTVCEWVSVAPVLVLLLHNWIVTIFEEYLYRSYGKTWLMN